jgi:hypothetical protein
MVAPEPRAARPSAIVAEGLGEGEQLGDRTYKVHLDGYDQTDMLTGKGLPAGTRFGTLRYCLGLFR